jgi:hypothetical protein
MVVREAHVPVYPHDQPTSAPFGNNVFVIKSQPLKLRYSTIITSLSSELDDELDELDDEELDELDDDELDELLDDCCCNVLLEELDELLSVICVTVG